MQPSEVRRRLIQRYLAAKIKPYAAIFLDPGSQTRLVSWWLRVVGIPLLSDLKAHHMTLKFDPSPADVQSFPLGEPGVLKVIGYASDEKGQAVLVRSNVRSHNPYPHVTMSVASGVSAAYSNDLLARGYNILNGPRLSGIVDVRQD